MGVPSSMYGFLVANLLLVLSPPLSLILLWTLVPNVPTEMPIKMDLAFFVYDSSNLELHLRYD
jgi:hypothetical protein